MREGDAVRLAVTESAVAAGTLGVVVETYPISDPGVVLVEFEGGKQLLALASIEKVTAVGGTGGRRGAARADPIAG